MNKGLAKTWDEIKSGDKKAIFMQAGEKMGLPAAAIEKDWWIVRTLEIVYTTEISSHTVFKGGTSLSKAWGLINRFSEDIDLALDRKYLGFDKEMTPSQVKRLREKSFKFISEKYIHSLQKAFHDVGYAEIKLKTGKITSDDQDPLTLEVYYDSVTDNLGYISPKVLIEIGSRSLIEPNTPKKICSFVGEIFSDRPFADKPIIIPAVNPERTFLEKIFLLHEEFQKPKEKIKVDRLSRHLYDIEKMMDTEYAEKGLGDSKLYKHIVEHRQTITPIRGIDYSNHVPTKINFIPPDEVLKEWEKDYKQMKESMIHSDSISFEKLLQRLAELKKRVNSLKFD